MSDERVNNLIKLYWKFRDMGLIVPAERTLVRIREVGGLEAVERAYAMLKAKAVEP